MVIILQHAAVAYPAMMGPLASRLSILVERPPLLPPHTYTTNTTSLNATHLRPHHPTPLALGQLRTRDIHVLAPAHARQRPVLRRPPLPRPQEASPRLARRVVCEPGRDGADVVVVPEEVEHDDDAYRRREPLVRQRGLDDLDCAEVFAVSFRGVEREKRCSGTNSQKQKVPREISTTARATKTGPAAPVSQSPKRSRALQRRKTCLVHDRNIPATRGSEGTQCRSRQRELEAACGSGEKRMCV